MTPVDMMWVFNNLGIPGIIAIAFYKLLMSAKPFIVDKVWPLIEKLIYAHLGFLDKTATALDDIGSENRKQTVALEDHGVSLAEHGKMIAAHGDTLNDHGDKLAQHGLTLLEIKERLTGGK